MNQTVKGLNSIELSLYIFARLSWTNFLLCVFIFDHAVFSVVQEVIKKRAVSFSLRGTNGSHNETRSSLNQCPAAYPILILLVRLCQPDDPWTGGTHAETEETVDCSKKKQKMTHPFHSSLLQNANCSAVAQIVPLSLDSSWPVARCSQLHLDTAFPCR